MELFWKVPLRNFVGVSQKGSPERCLPVLFFSENETEENGKKRKKTEKNGKNRNPKKTAKKEKKETEKTEENGKKRKKMEENRKKSEKIGSDTVPATPFAKSRLWAAEEDLRCSGMFHVVCTKFQFENQTFGGQSRYADVSP